MFRPMAFAALTLWTSCAIAQVPPQFLGTWKINWVSSRPYVATLVIAENGGSWRTLVQEGERRRNWCVGREVPISVEARGENAVQITLRFAEDLAGCTNDSVFLYALPAGGYAGNRGRYTLEVTKQ